MKKHNVIEKLKLNNKGAVIEMVLLASVLVFMFLTVIAYSYANTNISKRYLINSIDEKLIVESNANRYLRYLNESDYELLLDSAYSYEYESDKSTYDDKYINIYEDSNLVLEATFTYETDKYVIKSFIYRG